MDVVLIFNGLGNQMSQYAFYLAKKKHQKHCYIHFFSSPMPHNGNELGKVFGIKYPSRILTKAISYCYRLYCHRSTQWLTKLIGIKYIKEPFNYDYRPELLEAGPSPLNFYRGGWHSEKYFANIKQEIEKAFSFKIPSDDKVFSQWIETIKRADNSVSMHVRRGDFLIEDKYYKFNHVATIGYYQRALEMLRERLDSFRVFVFSDDLAWCREQFANENFDYVDCNSGLDSWRDMYLMTLCKHHINANSTFSWWGAWLNEENDSITIRPKWFIRDVETKDFYPKNWIEVI